MKATVRIALAALVTFASVAVQAQFPFGSGRNQQEQPKINPADPMVQMRKLNQFYSYVTSYYVDTVNTVKLVEDAIKGAVEGLDPHTAYISAKDMEEVAVSMEGSFSGIGIEFNVLNDTIMVVNVITGGPSQKIGLLPGDRIVDIDGKTAVGMKQNEVPGKLRGPKGTTVEIKVVRRGVGELLDFRIVRDNIPSFSINAAYEIAPGIGYVNVDRFAEKTMNEFEAAVSKLGRLDGMILDLRGNGGGILDQAVRLSNYFLPSGSVIVTTEGLRVPPERYGASRNGAFLKGKLVVLIDEGSASGSEIVAGALQDWDRAVLIGRRSFGKGLVQRQFPLIDGSSVRVTVAHYHTPTGRDIQRPYTNGDKRAYYEELMANYDNDSVRPNDSLKYRTLRLGKTVYGGGGIYPDIYVHADTTSYSQYWGRLSRRGVIGEWVLSYLDSDRKAIESKYKDIASFIKGYEVDDKAMASLVALGEKRGVEYDEAGMTTSLDAIRLQLKALVADRIWERGGFYMVMNTRPDPTVRRALEVLSDWESESAPFVTK